jgi:hypothetical protein
MMQLAVPGSGYAGSATAAFVVVGSSPVTHDGGPSGAAQPLLDVRGLRW